MIENKLNGLLTEAAILAQMSTALYNNLNVSSNISTSGDSSIGTTVVRWHSRKTTRGFGPLCFDDAMVIDKHQEYNYPTLKEPIMGAFDIKKKVAPIQAAQVSQRRTAAFVSSL